MRGIDLQDILCRIGWHKYTVWQRDTFSFKKGGVEGFRPVQMRFCYNCNWQVLKEIKIKGVKNGH